MCDSTKENAPPMTAVMAELQALTQKNTREMEALLAAFPQLQPREVPAIEAPPTPPALLAIEPAPADLTPIEPTPEELRVALAAAGLPSSSIGHPLVMKIVEAKRAAAMAAAHPQTEPVLDAELAPPPPPASTPEPGAQAQEMQLFFDNNREYVAYHKIVPGKTFDDLKALFPTDEEWEVFAAGAATYLPKQVWDAFLNHPDSIIDYYDAISKAEEEKMIKSQEMVPPLCRDEAGAKKLKANYERVLACYPALPTVLTFKMDEEKKVRAAFKAMVPTIPLVWQCAAADALVPQTPAQRDSVLLSATTKRLIELEEQFEKTCAERDAARRDAQKKTATIAERDERIASLEKCIAIIKSASHAIHDA